MRWSRRRIQANLRAPLSQIPNDMNAATVSLDVLMERIREEVERLRIHKDAPKAESRGGKLEASPRKASCRVDSSAESPAAIRVHLELEFPETGVSRAASPVGCALRYSELAKYDDDAFIRAAYLSVLDREPDKDGMTCYLSMLQDGASKAEILGRLRKSPEGRKRGAKIKGLAVPYAMDAVSRWPVIGLLVRLTTALCHLAEGERDERRKQAELRRWIANADARTEMTCRVSREALQRLEQALNAAGERLSAVDRTVRSLRHSVQAVQRDVTDKADSKPVAAKLNELSDGLRSKADHTAITGLIRDLEGALRRKADAESLNVELRHKADVELIDALKFAMDAAIESMRKDKADGAVLNEMHRQLLLSLEGKAERHEITALSNYIAEGLKQRASVAEIAPIAATLETIQEQIAELRGHKADLEEVERIGASVDAQLGAVRGELTSLRAQGAEMVEAASNTSRHELSEVGNGIRMDLARVAESLRLETRQVQSDIAAELGSELGRLAESVRTLDAAKVDRESIERLKGEAAAALEAKGGEISSRFREELATTNSRTRELKLSYLDQERRLQLLLEEARKRLPEPLSLQQLDAMAAEEEHGLASMYATFEDIFRGTREDIKNRQSIYLEYIRSAEAGTPKRPVLDIGCGRGEWLELLRDHGAAATGVDLNRVFLGRCRDLDLDVVEQDGLEFLRRCKANSFGAITSLHLIEHVPNRKLVALLDEALRALRPGGVLILETPNPRNLTVGACSFYFDPTHIRPLPPDYTRFLVEARGFVSVEVKELHPCPEEELISQGASQVRDTLNKFLFSARDYAVIGRKA